MRHRSFLLECTREDFKPRQSRCLTTAKADPREARLCRRLWRAVGEGYWTERFRWTEARWSTHLTRPDVSFWIASVSVEQVGCFELTRMVRGAKVQGFGLLPSHRGRGLGRELLTAATQRAFDIGAPKVWLHTATDDHPNALPNYLSGGYRIVRERELRKPLPQR